MPFQKRDFPFLELTHDWSTKLKLRVWKKKTALELSSYVTDTVFKFTLEVPPNTLGSGTLMKDMEMVDKFSQMAQNTKVTLTTEFSKAMAVTPGPNKLTKEAT